MQRCAYDFFAQPAAAVAYRLIGKLLVYESPAGPVGGRIVETEAYLGKDDPACHAARGQTKKNAAMFGSAGRNYLYHSYGVHICYNITADAPDLPAAVLLRAIEPLFGVKTMEQNRPGIDKERLCAGPGNLTRALGLDISWNGSDTLAGSLGVYDDGFIAEAIITGGRIGISRAQELPLRFYLAGSPCVSRK